jgi:MFS superfamily sulfate permease-like transporter
LNLFFVNAQDVADQITALVGQHKPRVLALDLSRVADIEYSALQKLLEGEKRMTEQGITVWLAGLNPGPLEVIRHAGLETLLGPDRLLFDARAAIERYTALNSLSANAAGLVPDQKA